jgi:hypothetical protein
MAQPHNHTTGPGPSVGSFWAPTSNRAEVHHPNAFAWCFSKTATAPALRP